MQPDKLQFCRNQNRDLQPTQDKHRQAEWKAEPHDSIPSWEEQAVISRPAGKANKGLMDI